MAIPRVYADFHNLDDENRLRLDCAGTKEDLRQQGIKLREGLELALYTDDADEQGRADELQADGLVQYNQQEQCWVARIDWSALRHASDVELSESRASLAATGERSGSK